MTANRSLGHTLPTFIIPVGTQVILRTNKLLSDGRVKPSGSVALVVESPADNRSSYRIRFADDRTTTAFFHELSLRRRELADRLVRRDEDLRPYVIYRCQVGSRAFGLATDDSDDDIRGVFLPPARLHWSLFKLPDQLEVTSESGDEVYWELEKFLKMALQANPNILEVLWTPLVLQANEVAERLLALREVFVTKHLYKTYSAYVLSQFRRMSNAFSKTSAYKPKHAMHLVRLLYSGIEALRTGGIRIDVAEHREELLQIKSGAWSFEQARAKALDLDRAFQDAFAQTHLPEQPDYERVDEFLIWARRRMVDA
jgi:predicted nucleotidyltransferase